MVEKARGVAQTWLGEIGLELNQSKTRIVHTAIKHKEQPPGFDFLGFTVRHFENRQSKKGYKLLIKPSNKSQKRNARTIHETIKTMRGAPQSGIIYKLNPIIKGWGRYYLPAVSRKVFEVMDHKLFKNLWSWANYKHPKKGKKWVKNKYFQVYGGRKWKFMTKDGRYKLIGYSDHLIKRHVKGTRSPYDGDWIYWSTRMGRYALTSPRVAKLLKSQCGKCAEYNLWFGPKDNIETHHRDGNRKNNKLQNLELLHGHCHDTVHGKCA